MFGILKKLFGSEPAVKPEVAPVQDTADIALAQSTAPYKVEPAPAAPVAVQELHKTEAPAKKAEPKTKAAPAKKAGAPSRKTRKPKSKA